MEIIGSVFCDVGGVEDITWHWPGIDVVGPGMGLGSGHNSKDV